MFQSATRPSVASSIGVIAAMVARTSAKSASFGKAKPKMPTTRAIEMMAPRMRRVRTLTVTLPDPAAACPWSAARAHRPVRCACCRSMPTGGRFERLELTDRRFRGCRCAAAVEHVDPCRSECITVYRQPLVMTHARGVARLFGGALQVAAWRQRNEHLLFVGAAARHVVVDDPLGPTVVGCPAETVQPAGNARMHGMRDAVGTACAANHCGS